MVADLGVVLAGVTKIEYKDSIPIETFINNFEEKWENMIVTAGGTLKEKHREFGNLLLGLGRSEMAKKEFLLLTFPTHITKYGQLVQNLRTREDYTYDDMVANIKQYAPQLVWKKNEDKKGTGSNENPVVLRTQQLTDRFGKPLDMNKSCGYCQNVKKWRGIGHTEQECKTKQREKEQKSQGGYSQVKGVETLDLDDHQDGGVAVNRLFVRMLKIAGQSPNQENRKGWYEYDTGAQTHTTNEKRRLINPQPYTNGVQGHDGHITQAELIGDIMLPNKGRNIMLRNVLYSPQFSNLISGLRSSKTCSLTRTGNQAMLTVEDKNVYQMEADQNGLWVKPDDLNITVLKVSSNKLQELHERYGHLSFPALTKLPEAKEILPEEFAKAECIACIKGKSTKPAARPSDIEIRTQETFERIHCDLIGPMETEWLGKKYVLTIVDDFSRYCIAIPIRAKSDTTEVLKQAIKEMNLATGRKVKTIQADWGGEFKNRALDSWCKSKGIIQKETVAYHSETNAIVKRLNRTLQNIARSAMIGAELKGL